MTKRNIYNQNNNITINQLISRKAVAELLGLSTMTIKRYGIKGLLHPIVIGPKVIRYDLIDVQNLVNLKKNN